MGPETRESPRARKPRGRQLGVRLRGTEGEGQGHTWQGTGSICSGPQERLSTTVLLFLVVSLVFEHLLSTELQARFEGLK